MVAVHYRKVVKYGKVVGGRPGEPLRLDPVHEIDVTALQVEEDGPHLRIADDGGRTLHEFGPGREFTGWTVEMWDLSPR